jgi:hypothetical protein
MQVWEMREGESGGLRGLDTCFMMLGVRGVGDGIH